MRKHGEHYASGKYSGAHKPTSSDSGDAVDAQANTNPRIDSEVASSSQPQMSTRATRIVRRPTRFLDSSDEDDSDSETPNPIPFPKPPSDSEVTSPPQPQMSTRATRIVRRPTRFLDSSDEDDSDSETPNPIPFPKPPSDSEVTSPPQPQMSTRATRIVGALLDFLTVVTKMIAIVRLQLPYLFQNLPATQRLQVSRNRRCLRVMEDPQSVQFVFKTAATWNLENRSVVVLFVSGL